MVCWNPFFASSNIPFFKSKSSANDALFSALEEYWIFIFWKNPFLDLPFLSNGKNLLELIVRVGRVKLTNFDWVFWDIFAFREILTPELPGKLLEYDIDELKLLFRKLAVLSWFTDCLK